jgi:hypothetical protein
MQLLDGRLVFSATDLAGFSPCGYLTALDRDYVTSKVAPFASPTRSPFAELLSKRGSEHESEYVAKIVGSAASYRAIDLQSRTLASYEAAAAETLLVRQLLARLFPPCYQSFAVLGTDFFLLRS